MEEEFVDDEIDLNYEFDAPRFYDFSKPETFWDSCEAEHWFEFAQSCPPSPFLVKLGNGGTMDNLKALSMQSQQVSTMEDNKGGENKNSKQTTACHLRKSSSSKSKDFTFMKPTACHLAKLKKSQEVQSPQYSRRIQEKSSSSIDILLTKRQKLLKSCLHKVAQLKNQTLLTNKKTKEVDHSNVNLTSKSNVTVPREPNLQTALRARSHKSKTNTDSGEHTKSSFQGGVTLNRNSSSSSETRTNTSVGSKQEKCRMISKLRCSSDGKKLSSKGERGVFRNIKVFPLEPNDRRFMDEPLTEQLSKSFKENRPRSMRQEQEMMNLVKESGKQYECAHEMRSLKANFNAGRGVKWTTQPSLVGQYI